MAKYIELIDKYSIEQGKGDYNPPSYRWVDNTGEIVRCYECVNWERDWEPNKRGNDGMEWHYCPIIDSSSHSDWFCADGEREVQDV